MRKREERQKTLSKITSILLFAIVLVNCQEQGLIKGKPGEILTDGNIRLKVITVFQKGSGINPFDTKKSLTGLIVVIENGGEKDLQIRWISGEYSGEDLQDNYWWVPVYPADVKLPETLTTEGIIGMPKTEEIILSKEKKLKFTPITLKSSENCKTFIGGAVGMGGNPEAVRLKVRLGDNTEKGPFLIVIPEKNQQ